MNIYTTGYYVVKQCKLHIAYSMRSRGGSLENSKPHWRYTNGALIVAVSQMVI